MWLMIAHACTPLFEEEVDPTNMNTITWQCFEIFSTRNTKAGQPKEVTTLEPS